MRLFFHKLTHWEYWPFHVVYFPVFFLWAYYSIKARTIFFFSASNPGIKNSGFMAESKKEIHDIIPREYVPITILIPEGSTSDEVQSMLLHSAIKFPCIAKPDIGLRGSAVKKIESSKDLVDYNNKASFDYLIQDFIPFQKEVGIFYVRHPKQQAGRITGIVSKEFVIVTGDGVSTKAELVMKIPRYAFQLKNLQREYGDQLNDVVPNGVKVNLVPYGNHVRGAKFLDASHRISDKLTNVMNEICIKIPGFYFGRLDIMYSSFDELEAGRNFLIVELNGAASEPTHIYDPKHSIFFAWKELFRHISIMNGISAYNNKNGIPYLNYKEGMNEYRIHLAHNKKILNF
ncbi:MAG TPA: D-alanine--D-alanine ligase [Flavobacterium sp.]|jgi:hypothetical protein